MFEEKSRELPSSKLDHTSQVCKVMEKIITKGITVHLVNNNLLSDHQHSFVPQKPWQTNILEGLEDWTKYLDINQSVGVPQPGNKIYCIQQYEVLPYYDVTSTWRSCKGILNNTRY